MPPRHWRALAAAAALGLFASASAQVAPATPAKTLYKLVDRSGKVTYVDQIPKGFDGEVTRIEVDEAPAPGRPLSAPSPAGKQKASTVDTNAARRALRERLQADIDRAHEKLAAARKALADGVDPKEGEYQPIQQKWDASRAKEGEAGPRPNCRKQVAANGAPYWMCPTIVPGESYRDRQKELEEAVRTAEADLERAQYAYRRNVD